MRFHEKILGARQRQVLKELGTVVSRGGFYLGGGTALALQLGHRQSADFDWFAPSLTDPSLLAQDLRDAGLAFQTELLALGTLLGRIHGVHVSFFAYPYALLRSPRPWPKYACRVASLDDLAAMKLTAIAQRGGKKDFVDIYALCAKHAPLGQLLKVYQRKFSVRNLFHLLASLTFFDDADRDRMPRLLWRLRWATIKKSLKQWVQAQG